MFVYEQKDSLHIVIQPDETMCFRELVSFVHKSVNMPVSIFITFSGRSLKGLDVVENFEILFDHTPINDLTLIVEPENSKYADITRAARFISQVYGYPLTIQVGRVIE